MKCPHCNKEMTPTPIQELECHIEKSITSNRAKGHDDAAEKWESWRDALRKRINKFEDPLLDLSIRARRVVGRADINSIDELSQTSMSELIMTRNCGETTINEMKELLSSNGYTITE